MRFFEDIEVGQRREVGSFTFTADAIKKFAAQFDPQRFHLRHGWLSGTEESSPRPPLPRDAM